MGLGSKMDTPADVKYHADVRLLTWHPSGVLDHDTICNVIAFIEHMEYEMDEPFNRFVDFSNLTDVKLQVEDIVRVSMHRRKAYSGGEPIQCAILSTNPEADYVAKVHELLTAKTPIHVAVFSNRTDAARWLGVAEELLLPS